MKLLKKAGIIIGIGIVVLTITYKYLYHEQRNIASEEAKFITEALKLTDEFKDNSLNATNKYLNNVIIVKGVLTEVENDGIALNDNVYMQLEKNEGSNLELHKQITVKGRFIGYDELLECVKLDQCTIIN